MSKPPSYELATLTALDKVTSEDDNEIIEASSSIGLYPLGPQPREDISRAPSPIPGSLDPESAIDRTTPTPSKFLIAFVHLNNTLRHRMMDNPCPVQVECMVLFSDVCDNTKAYISIQNFFFSRRYRSGTLNSNTVNSKFHLI